MHHTELSVWKNSMELVALTYEYTSKLPKHERFGFTSQMNRTALSVPSNIAEGAARSSTKDYIRFLYNALGSATELETQYLATILLKINSEDKIFKEKITSVLKLLLGQIKSLKAKL